MSEAPKTVEELVQQAPAATEAVVVAEPVVESTPAETVEPTVEAPAATQAATEEEPAAPVAEDVRPVEEGVLGYKGPGLLKGLIFQKKFFWFGTDAVETKALQSYLRGEKDTESANNNAAWASYTGKGLLFFSKKAVDKATPAGIFNLSEIKDVTEEGPVEFHFLSGGHKHTFQASSLAERDNWVSVLKTKVEEALASVDSIKETEEYKKTLGDFVKPAVVAPVVAPVVAAKKAEEPKEEVAEPAKEDKKEVKEEKKTTRKSRSASRKRASIFGNIGFGKKEEKVETPVEATAPAAEEAVATPATEEPVAVTEAAPATTDVPVLEETATPAVEEPATPVVAKPTPSKRSSIFGTLKSQFSKEKKTEEAAPVVHAKDTESEPVSETAPVIPQVESTEPLAAATEAIPEATPSEPTEAPVAEKVAETPVTKAEKRKSSLPWLSKKEKATSDEESEKPKSPFAKLRATVKGKSTPKTEKAAEAGKVEDEATPAIVEPAVEEPVISEPVPALATTPQVTASA